MAPENMINPVYVSHTTNVAKELLRVATSNKVPVDSLDFVIQGVHTFIKTHDESSDGEWLELFDDDYEEYSQESVLRDARIEIKQEYDVEIHSHSSKSKLKHFQCSVAANSTVTKVYLAIKQGSKLAYYDTLTEELMSEVNKKKLRANIMIMMFEKDLRKQIEEYVAKVRVAEEYVVDKKEVILIAEGLDPIPTVNDKLVMHVKQRVSRVDEFDRVDHSNRGFLLSCLKDDLLIEYVKPKLGQAGRNCRGEFIGVDEPTITNEPTFEVTDKIRIEDDENSKRFYASESGYLVYTEDGKYDIRHDIELDKISFKETGSIETQLDANITISVGKGDIFEDAVEKGLRVIVSNLNVQGSIGSNTLINTNKIDVRGQTHRDSKIVAEKAVVNVHKGTLIANDVTVTRIEQGVIEAESVKVEQALGGTIKAKTVYIETLGSHMNVHASESIEFERTRGSENRFMITPLVNSKIEGAYKEVADGLDTCKNKISSLNDEIYRYEESLTKSNKAFVELKNTIIKYKKAKKKVPENYAKKYREFLKAKEHLEQLKSEIDIEKYNKEKLEAKQLTFQDDLSNAYVKANCSWKGHNKITFKLMDPDMELEYIPKDGLTRGSAVLHEDENGQFEIRYKVETSEN